MRVALRIITCLFLILVMAVSIASIVVGLGLPPSTVIMPSVLGGLIIAFFTIKQGV